MTTSPILEGFASSTSATPFTITNAGIASSPTGGWQSNPIDNSSNLYDDALVMCDVSVGAGTIGSSKAAFFFAFAILDGGGTAEWTSTGDGAPGNSEATLTFPDITTTPVIAPLLGVLPVSTQSKQARGGPWSVARCFGGVLPPKWKIGMINHSGITFSGAVNSIKYLEVKYTVG